MAQEDKKKSGSFQIIVFKQGGEEYALTIDQIKEVVITPTITRMPQTPPYIKGVANIRGNIIAILDLEEKFNLTQGTDVNAGQNYTLVVESNDFKMGILVREVPNTLTVTAANFDDSLAIISDLSSEANYVKGVIKIENRLIVLIDIFKVLDTEILGNFKKNVVAA
jgi:purine-binding chemotaxis protein CheW